MKSQILNPILNLLTSEKQRLSSSKKKSDIIDSIASILKDLSSKDLSKDGGEAAYGMKR